MESDVGLGDGKHRTMLVRLPQHGGEGILGFPEGQAKGLVLFAHGSASSRLSPRNAYVADALQRAGLATLLFDLLSEEEAEERARVFDIELLATRLREAIAWVRSLAAGRTLPLGLFGASTGAAAALVAAAGHDDVSAIVCRGGRVDLADGTLARVTAPTLLVVGGDDTTVLELNRWAYERLRCERRLAIVPGATHLFEEAGALDAVVRLARDWFLAHLGAVAAPSDDDVAQ